MIAQLVTAASSFDDISIHLPGGLSWGVKALIAAFLFAVALEVRVSDIREVARRPTVFAVGLGTQFVLIPALSLVLIAALDVRPSIALGLLLVVCCPAGNLSNILTYRARGDVALSVSLTAVSSALAVIVTPVTLAFWGSLSPRVSSTLDRIDLSPTDVLLEVGAMIVVPFVAGLLFAHRYPERARRARRFVEPAILVLLAVLIVGGLAGNAPIVVESIRLVGAAIVLQNLMSLLVGYGAATACRLPAPGRRAMTLEMGIRNTGLGLVLALTFFGSIGGVAVTVALWGLWDLITGFALSSWWRRSADPMAPRTRPQMSRR